MSDQVLQVFAMPILIISENYPRIFEVCLSLIRSFIFSKNYFRQKSYLMYQVSELSIKISYNIKIMLCTSAVARIMFILPMQLSGHRQLKTKHYNIY